MIDQKEKVLPQFSLDEDSILNTHSVLPENWQGSHLDDSINLLSSKYGVEVSVDDDGSCDTQTDIFSSIGVHFGLGEMSPQDHEAIGLFIGHIGVLLRCEAKADTDPVVTLNWLSKNGLDIGVHPHFQRWLNSGVNPTIFDRSVLSMAIPFGREQMNYAAEKLERYPNGSHAGFIYRATTQKQKFGLYNTTETEEYRESRNGSVNWTEVDLSTLGSCACFGVPYDERERVSLDPQFEDMGLYRLTPHNVDIETQALSLFLGLSVLTDEAGKYDGREDIFADTVWEEPKRYDHNGYPLNTK